LSTLILCVFEAIPINSIVISHHYLYAHFYELFTFDKTYINIATSLLFFIRDISELLYYVIVIDNS